MLSCRSLVNVLLYMQRCPSPRSSLPSARCNHRTWRDAGIIGKHLVDAVAIAVQRCTGMALQRSQRAERDAAMGVRAA